MQLNLFVIPPAVAAAVTCLLLLLLLLLLFPIAPHRALSEVVKVCCQAE